MIGVNVGGTISYLASDGLGSVTEAVDGSGTVTAAQLFALYGGMRYSSGTMSTSKAFTGQRSDAATSGLDYYGARYYDPVLGQFTSADTKQGPNRYAYVADDPETLSDSTGQRYTCPEPDGCGGGGGGVAEVVAEAEVGGQSSMAWQLASYSMLPDLNIRGTNNPTISSFLLSRRWEGYENRWV